MNVLQRVYLAAKKYNAEGIVQISGDSIFLDPEITDQMISIYKKNKVDAVVDYWNTFPSGINPTILSFKALNRSYKKFKSSESVGYHIFKNPKIFKTYYYFPKPSEYFPKLKLCLDTFEDYLLIKKIFSKDKKNNYSCKKIILTLKKNLFWLKINSNVKRKSTKDIREFLK